MSFQKKTLHDSNWNHKKHLYHDCGCEQIKHENSDCGCVCNKLANLTPGTPIFLTIDGITQGPFIFANLCKEDCCVTLISRAAINPSGTVFIVDCKKIDFISFDPSTNITFGL